MATERLSMRMTREILRHKLLLGRTHRAVAASLGVSAGKVHDAFAKAKAAELSWAAVEALDDEALETRLYGSRAAAGGQNRPLPDFGYLHAERRKLGVTLELLHLEYLEQHPDGYRYSQFCDYYRGWLAKRKLTMRQDHLAGDKLFTDYSGKKPHIVDPVNGERIDVELFVAVLGGVTAMVVPDQLKSGVTQACRYPPCQRS
jgi:transposase